MTEPVSAADEALARYAALLRSRFGARIERIVLFGSRARGAARPDSDMDVLVVIDTLTHAERVEAIDLAYAALEGHVESAPMLTPLVWTRAEHADRLSRERRIALEIERDGIAV